MVGYENHHFGQQAEQEREAQQLAGKTFQNGQTPAGMQLHVRFFWLLLSCRHMCSIGI